MLDGDVFIEDPVTILNQIEQFLNIPNFFTSDHFDFTGFKIFKFIMVLRHPVFVGKHGFPCFKLDPSSHSRCMSDSKARDHPELSVISILMKLHAMLPNNVIQ